MHAAIPLLLLLASLLPVQTASACIFREMPSLAEAVAEADIVFVGHLDPQADREALEVLQPFERFLIVDKVWKGTPGKMVSDYHPSLSCGAVDYEPGIPYLIYLMSPWDGEPAYRRSEPWHYNRIRPLIKAQIEAKYLTFMQVGRDATSIDNALPHIVTDNEFLPTRLEAIRFLNEIFKQPDRPNPPSSLAALISAAGSEHIELAVAAIKALNRPLFRTAPPFTPTMLRLVGDPRKEIADAALSALYNVDIRDHKLFDELAKAFTKQQAAPDHGTAVSDARLTQLANGIARRIRFNLDQMPLAVALLSNAYQASGDTSVTFSLLKFLRETHNNDLKRLVIESLAEVPNTLATAAILPYIKDDDCLLASTAMQAVYDINPTTFEATYMADIVVQLTARFDACPSRIIRRLRNLPPAAYVMEPLMIKKLAGMKPGQSNHITLKRLLFEMDRDRGRRPWRQSEHKYRY